jgi:hypothetical protein
MRTGAVGSLEGHQMHPADVQRPFYELRLHYAPKAVLQDKDIVPRKFPCMDTDNLHTDSNTLCL